MNGLDIAICAGCVAAVLLGAARGLTRLLVVTGFIILGWWLALRYQIPVSRALIGVEDGPGVLVGFGLIFLVTLVAGGLIGRLMHKLLRAAELRWVDRLAGAAAGLVVTGVMAAAILLPLASALPAEHPLVRESLVAPPLLRLTGLLLPLVPEEVQRAYEKRRRDAELILSGS